MQQSININWKYFWLNLGWYSGDPFKLLSLTIGESFESHDGKIDQVTFFGFQTLYFVFAFGWHRP